MENTLSLGDVSPGICFAEGNFPFFRIAAVANKSSLSIPPLFFAYFSNSTPAEIEPLYMSFLEDSKMNGLL